MVVTDGNMKITRKICAAKFSVVRIFKQCNKMVLTGCTSMPNPDSPFCSEHLNAETPVLLAEKVSRETKKSLVDFKERNQQSNLQLPKDSVFFVESILNSKLKKGVSYFLVKFAGYPVTEACWEPSKNLPKFIQTYYEDATNHGKPLPSPIIKYTTKVNDDTEIYQHLEWNVSDAGEKLKSFDSEKLFELEMQKLAADELRSTCNTQKLKDKRDRRHTAGIVIHAKPCGKIPHVDELYKCESIKQVYGSIIEYLGILEKKEREKVKFWLLDDMCHMKPFSEKEQQAGYNEITNFFASLPKAVDRFHFPGHKKSDKYCQDNCNPDIHLKNLGIMKQNTSACEQAFKWLNGYKNLKTMNEARFRQFLIYMIDLHNMNIDCCVDIAANPLNPKRLELTENIHSNVEAQVDIEVDDLITSMKNMLTVETDVEDKFEHCFKEVNGALHCNFCNGVYKKEGHLRNHLESKHNKHFELVCVCGKPFPDFARLTRHKKSCISKKDLNHE